MLSFNEKASYPPLSALQSKYNLQPAHCMCPHHLAPPAGWSACDNILRCRSRSVQRAGWHCCLCTSGCYIWGWILCSPRSHGSSQGPSCLAEVSQYWLEALKGKECRLNMGLIEITTHWGRHCNLPHLTLMIRQYIFNTCTRDRKCEAKYWLHWKNEILLFSWIKWAKITELTPQNLRIIRLPQYGLSILIS